MNPLISFLQEMFLRLSTKSPLFFKVIQVISGTLALAMFIPATLQAMHIEIPPFVAAHIDLVLAKCASVAFVISMLTTKSAAIGVTNGGSIIKTTDESKLPFTAAAEKKSAEKKGASTVEINHV